MIATTRNSMDHSSFVKLLRDQVSQHERQLDRLKDQLAQELAQVDKCSRQPDAQPLNGHPSSGGADRIFPPAEAAPRSWGWPLPYNDYNRYGRQMVVPEIGLEGTGHPVWAADAFACHN